MKRISSKEKTLIPREGGKGCVVEEALRTASQDRPHLLECIVKCLQVGFGRGEGVHLKTAEQRHAVEKCMAFQE